MADARGVRFETSLALHNSGSGNGEQLVRNKWYFLLTAVIVFAMAPAMAGTLYDNGPINPNNGSWLINNVPEQGSWGSVTDSFVLSSSSTVTGATVGIWVFAGRTPEQVDWAITSSPFGGTTYGSGTASFTNNQVADLDGMYDVDLSSFSTGSLALAAGTYWLQLSDASTSNPHWDWVNWAESDGPSLAWETGNYYNNGGTYQLCSACVMGGGSESFQINGYSSLVPEPGSLALTGSGVLLAGLLRRRLRPVVPSIGVRRLPTGATRSGRFPFPVLPFWEVVEGKRTKKEV